VYADLVKFVQEQAPWITVESGFYPGGATEDLWARVLTNVAAGTPPDLSHTFVANWATLGAKNIAIPINEMLKASKTWRFDDYFDGIREAINFKGKVVVAPSNTGPMAVAVNLDMLASAGLRPPAESWTWETFTDYAVKLTKRNGDTTSVWGAQMPAGVGGFGVMNFFGGPLWSHGGDWADRQKDVLTFHRPEGVAALEMWINVALRQQAAPTTQPADWQGVQGGPFVAGKVAMAFIGSPTMSDYLRLASGINWTIAPMPRNKERGAHYFAGGFFAIQGTSKVDAAAEFIRLSALPERLADWCARTYGMPTTRASTQHRLWQDLLAREPRVKAFSDTTAYMRSYPLVPGWTEASIPQDGIGWAIMNAVQGKVAPKVALEEAARKAAAQLDVTMA
jgi:ABC-type glycerol-3-phosphate transport system substrate-binding protein